MSKRDRLVAQVMKATRQEFTKAITKEGIEMELDANGSEGNAFYIMGLVKEVLIATDRADEIPDVLAAMTSADYNHLCDVAEEVTNGTITVVNREGLGGV